MLPAAYVVRFLHPDLTPLLVVAGDATGPAGTPGLVQYGAVGIVASLAISGLMYFVKQQAAELKSRADQAAAAYREAVARGDRLESEVKELHRKHAEECRDLNRAHADEIRELHRKNVETVIPSLTMAQEAARDMQALARETQEFMRDLSRGGASR